MKFRHLFFVLICTTSFAQAAGLSLEKVVIALKPDKNPDAMLEERKTLSAALAGKLDRPVEVIVPLSAAVIVEGLANGSIDLAYVSAMDMVNIRDAKAGSLLLAGKIDGQPGYKSYWVTLRDKPYQDIADLADRTVAFSSKSSTSGFLIPLVDLHRRGLIGDDGNPETFFGKDNVWYGSGYVSAIERVLAGEAEAAAVSYYVLDEDKHLTPEQKSRLRKLQEQGPVPSHVLAISARVPASDREALEAALLALNQSDAGVDRGVFSAELAKVEESEHLAPVDAALALVGRKKK